MRNRKILFVLVGMSLLISFLSFTTKRKNFQKTNDNAVFQKKWLYTLLLNSYYTAYFSGPKNIEDLKKYLNYLKKVSKEPAIENLVLNDKMNIYYTKDRKYLYLYHYGLDGQDHHMTKYVFLTDSNKLISDYVKIGKIKVKDADIVLGKITLFDVCNDVFVFRAFHGGLPVPDSVRNAIISDLKPQIDSLQRWLRNNMKLNWNATLVKSRHINDKWSSKLLCLQKESKEKNMIIEKIDSILTLTKINVAADSLYFPLFYRN